MIIHKVNHEVREPRVLTLTLEKTAEKFKALLTKVVSEQLERHKSLIAREWLGKKSKTKVIDLIVSHINVDQTLVYGNSLSNCFCSVVRTLIVCEMEGLETAVFTL